MRAARIAGYRPASSPTSAPVIGAPAARDRSSTGVHPFTAETTTTAMIPALLPSRPPKIPTVTDSTRNCAATCRRRAPSERRRPISPTRSITVTRVTLAMPIAPTTSETSPSTTNNPLTSCSTPPRRLAGSGGARTCSESCPLGLNAIGAWRAIRLAAPRSVRMRTFVAAPAANRSAASRSAAVVYGSTTEVSSARSRSRSRPASPKMPITVNARPSTNTAGWSSTRVMPSSFAAPAPSTATRSWRLTWPSSKNRPCAIVAFTTAGSPAVAATTGRARSVPVGGRVVQLIGAHGQRPGPAGVQLGDRRRGVHPVEPLQVGQSRPVDQRRTAAPGRTASRPPRCRIEPPGEQVRPRGLGRP